MASRRVSPHGAGQLATARLARAARVPSSLASAEDALRPLLAERLAWADAPPPADAELAAALAGLRGETPAPAAVDPAGRAPRPAGARGDRPTVPPARPAPPVRHGAGRAATARLDRAARVTGSLASAEDALRPALAERLAGADATPPGDTGLATLLARLRREASGPAAVDPAGRAPRPAGARGDRRMPLARPQAPPAGLPALPPSPPSPPLARRPAAASSGAAAPTLPPTGPPAGDRANRAPAGPQPVTPAPAAASRRAGATAPAPSRRNRPATSPLRGIGQFAFGAATHTAARTVLAPRSAIAADRLAAWAAAPAVRTEHQPPPPGPDPSRAVPPAPAPAGGAHQGATSATPPARPRRAPDVRSSTPTNGAAPSSDAAPAPTAANVTPALTAASVTPAAAVAAVTPATAPRPGGALEELVSRWNAGNGEPGADDAPSMVPAHATPIDARHHAATAPQQPTDPFAADLIVEVVAAALRSEARQHGIDTSAGRMW